MPRKASSKPADFSADLRGGELFQSDAKPQVVGASKENLMALSGQPFYSTQIPVCLWFSGKNEIGGKCRTASELALAA